MDIHVRGARAPASLFLLMLVLLPQSAQPGWNERNPCPQCAREKEMADYFAQRLAGIDIEVQSTRELLDASDRKRLQALHRIDDIGTRLDDEQGAGGESFDPDTGITVRSYDRDDGRVQVDTLDPDGKPIESHIYPRRSSEELVKERAEREAEVKAAEDQAVRLRTQLNTAERTRERAQADLDQAHRALLDCIAVRCGQTSGGAAVAARSGTAAGEPAAEQPAAEDTLEASGMSNVIN